MGARGLRIGVATSAITLIFAASAKPSTASQTPVEAPVESATNYQIDAAHDGHAQAADVTLPYKLIWSVPAVYPSYPIIAQSLVIVTMKDPSLQGRSVYAFNAKTGATVWSRELQGAWSYLSAAYENGRVFVVGQGPTIWALDAATGATIWLKVVGTPTGPPTASGGTLYIATDPGTYALNEATGATIWRSGGGGYKTAPTVADGRVIVPVGCDIPYVTSLNGVGGWHLNNTCAPGDWSTAPVWQGLIYAHEASGAEFVRNETTGGVTGSFASSQTPAFDDTDLFAISGGSIMAVGLHDGTVLWKSDPALLIVTQPLVIGSFVVAESGDGIVYAFDKSTGRILWSGRVESKATIPEANPASDALAAAGPLLVVPNGDRLVAFRAQGPWTLQGVPPVLGSPATAPPAGSQKGQLIPASGPGRKTSGSLGGLILSFLIIGGFVALVAAAETGSIERRAELAKYGNAPPAVRPAFVVVLGIITVPLALIFGLSAFGDHLLNLGLIQRILILVSLYGVPVVLAIRVRAHGIWTSLAAAFVSSGAMLMLVIPLAVALSGLVFSVIVGALIGAALGVGNWLGKKPVTTTPPADTAMGQQAPPQRPDLPVGTGL